MVKNALLRGAARIAAICAMSFVLTASGQAQNHPSAKSPMPGWDKLRAAYEVNPRQALQTKETPQENPDGKVLHLTFTGPEGEKVVGLFARPKAAGTYPVCLLLHGLTSSKEVMGLWFGKALVEKGVAILALDAPHHGERKAANENQVQFFGETMWQGCREYRLALEWLAKRPDVDMRHIGLIGYSMGSMMGSILGGVEPRIGPVALCVGGDVMLSYAERAAGKDRENIYCVSSSLYIGHISPRPVLMLNGKEDNVVNEKASQLLYNATGEPKQQIWYDSGHILPKEANDKAVSWIVERLKPGAKNGSKAESGGKEKQP